MVVYCPGLYQLHRNAPDLILNEHIDFWYDSLNDCYINRMPSDMLCRYIEAINDEENQEHLF